jgi:hypothetical protein
MTHALPAALTAAAWRGPDLARRTDWIVPLGAAEIADLERAMAVVRRSGTTRAALTIDDVPLGALADTIAGWRRELAHGRGFLLARGLPVDRWSLEDATLAYWILGLHLGTPVPQNFTGELLTDVRDTGADPADPSTRLYRTRAEQDFHTDGADIIGLLCLRTARRGGESRIVSSLAVFEEIRRRDPALADVLFEDFPWHYYDPAMPAPTFFVRPICAVRGGGLNTAFIPWYIRRAHEVPGAPALTDAQARAVTLMETVANDPALYLDMEFRPGDVQLLKNSVILHKRTSYEDWDDPAEKRHLLRLWLAAPDFEDGDEQLRGGIGLRS